MASNDLLNDKKRKEGAILKLKKNLERQKKQWLSKNVQKLIKSEQEGSSSVEEEQMCTKENYPSFIRDWHESLQQKNEAKKQEVPVEKSVELELIKRAHEKELKEKRREKSKPRDDKFEFLPAIKSFVQKRTLLSKKKFDFLCRSDEKPRAISPLPTLTECKESDEEISSDENLENLDGIFLCNYKSDPVEISKEEPISKTTSFSFKPNKVIFKDFEVNKIYKQKIKIINISASALSCKLIGVSDIHIRSVISMELQGPVKQLMPGMNCTLTVKFSPDDEDLDLDASIIMKSESGLFSIPLEIKKKFCCVSLQPPIIDFGIRVVGSKSSKNFQIINNGSKKATYKILADELLKKESKSISLKSAPELSKILNRSDKSMLSSKRHSSNSSYDVEFSNKEFMVETGSQTPTTPSSGELDSVASKISSVKELEELDGLQLNGKEMGEINGNDKVTIEIVYIPQIPGPIARFFTVQTSDFKNPSFTVCVKAEAKTPFVTIKENSYNFNICAYNHLYQQAVIVVNSENVKHDVTVDIPKSLKSHVDIIPRNGVIKCESEFMFQLKFFPRNTLSCDAPTFFDESTGILEFPLTFHVSEQPLPVKCSIHAVVSTTQIEFDPSFIDFGECYINESVQADVTMKNLGILSQQFGFVDLPNFINVEPNDGFGIILPKEIISIKMVFKPEFPMKHNASITCKTLFNRIFTIKWAGTAIQPPIRFSHSLVSFAATRLNNISTATIFLKNEKSKDQWISFEFDISENCPVQIIPKAGQILGGKSQKINLIFSPKLLEQEIYYEALNFLMETQETANLDYESDSEIEYEEDEMSETSKETVVDASDANSQKNYKKNQMEKISPKSVEYHKAVEKLTCDFQDRVDLFSVPCYFIEGKIEEIKANESNFSTMKPINLSFSCPFLKPKLKLLSPKKVDFGKVSIGKKCFASVVVCNITFNALEVEAHFTNNQDTFSVRKTRFLIQPKKSRTFLVSFLPMQDVEYFEKLEMTCPGDSVFVILTAVVLKPELEFSFDEQGSIFECKRSIVGDFSSTDFTVKNLSQLPLEISFEFVSSKDEDFQSHENQNFNGLNPFNINPLRSIMEPEQTRSITVTFTPDHTHLFWALVKVIVYDHYTLRTFSLQSSSSKLPVSVKAENSINFNVNTLLLTNINAIRFAASGYEENSNTKMSFGPLLDDDSVLYLFFDDQKHLNHIEICYIQNNLFQAKKAAEFAIDNLHQAEKLGFSFDVIKGVIDYGKKTSILVKYSPNTEEIDVTPSVIIRVKTDTNLLTYTVYLFIK